MSDIKAWSPAASGNSVAEPNGFLERVPPAAGILCGKVDNSFREVMAAVHKQFMDVVEWLDLGHTVTSIIDASTIQLSCPDGSGVENYRTHHRIRIKNNGTYRTGTILVGADSYDSVFDPVNPPETAPVIQILLDGGVALLNITEVAFGIPRKNLPQNSTPVFPCGSAVRDTAPTDGQLNLKDRLVVLPLLKFPRGMLLRRIGFYAPTASAAWKVSIAYGLIDQTLSAWSKIADFAAGVSVPIGSAWIEIDLPAPYYFEDIQSSPSNGDMVTPIPAIAIMGTTSPFQAVPAPPYNNHGSIHTSHFKDQVFYMPVTLPLTADAAATIPASLTGTPSKLPVGHNERPPFLAFFGEASKNLMDSWASM